MTKSNGLVPIVGDDRGRPALLVDGVVQSVTAESAGPEDYWRAMLPDARPTRALLLGAGGGTLAALLTRRFGGVQIVAVDDDPRVVRIGRERFYLGLPNVQVVIADAFAFAAACRGHFELVAVDLFRGAQRPSGLVSRPFLADLRRLAAPRGSIFLNLFDDARLSTTISRIERVLTVMRRRDTGKNVVLQCRG